MKDDKKKKTAEDEILDGLAEFSSHLTKNIETGTFAVRISDDKMKAFVKVPAPDEVPTPYDKKKVMDGLAENGVKFGIDDIAIDEIFTFASFNVDVEIAKGKPPTNGVDGKVEYKVDVSGETSLNLQEDEHGNIDMRAMHQTTSVEEGAVIAVKTPAQTGEPGINVLGQEIPAVMGKEGKVLLGANVELQPDGITIIATKSGQPILKDNKLTISAVYEVKGDVNFKTGNVDFNGSVIIRGNVLSDFIVKATDDIDIFGNVEKATIIAGGNVRITGGIYGATEGSIKAEGNIKIRSSESAILEAGGSITIDQAARYSTLMAGEDIIITNPKGSIIGGKASAGHHFMVANIGAQSFTETIIEIGMNPRLRRTYEQIEKAIEEHKVQLDKAIKTIKTIKDAQAAGQPIGPDKIELLKKLVPATHQLKANLETETQKMEFLKNKMKTLQAGRARIMYKVYPGVKFFSLNASMPIQREINHSAFYESNNQIIVGPY